MRKLIIICLICLSSIILASCFPREVQPQPAQIITVVVQPTPGPVQEAPQVIVVPQQQQQQQVIVNPPVIVITEPPPVYNPPPVVYDNCIATRLYVGGCGRVNNANNGQRNHCRTSPTTFEENNVVHIDPYDKFTILDGPICNTSNSSGEYWRWWKVQTYEEGAVCWTAEGPTYQYWLEPCY